MKIAYLINQYPKVSHSFVRTEILSLEGIGHEVTRIGLRGWDAELADPLDLIEQRRTRYVLRAGILEILVAVMCALQRPARVIAAIAAACKLGYGGERGVGGHLIYLVEACVVLRWVRAAKIEHIHAHFGSNGAAVALLTFVLGGPPYSFTVHGPEEFDKPLQWKLREKIAQAQAVIAISSYCRSQLYRWSPPSQWSKIHIVHCALDPRFDAELATEPPQNKRLVCVGRLCEQKGQLLLLQAVEEVRKRGVNVTLVLAGDGKLRKSLEAAIEGANLGDAVTITGWLSAQEVGHELDKCRGLILPSFAEGLPVVIMEAMARQRPVLTTYIAGIPELVRDGIEGIMVPSGDCNALADAICALLGMDQEQLSKMGRAAAVRVKQRHSAANEAKKLVQIFSQGTAPQRPGARSQSDS